MGWHEKRFEQDANKAHKKCANCGRDMWLPPSKASVYQSCSKECGKSIRQSAVEARKRKCKTCGNEFTPRKYQIDNGLGRYCSQLCNEASRIALHADEAKAKAKAVQAQMRERGEMNMACGPRNPNWNGGVYRGNGYILLKRDGKYVPEHRLVVEEHIGRKLRNDEVVHHINHDKTDNRIENLQVMSRAEHIEEHRADLIDGLRRACK
ncbi:HNH endonuclease signature motif containing protein [Vreelandella populi]|uniref:HNH endonuclease signature motif containing protein n=1 Tax=Vreelandella populi TaxID=2498858 RepID=UPI00163BC6ED|nr:HNH endonuclease signature motif containing protein [Halomonas populi]